MVQEERAEVVEEAQRGRQEATAGVDHLEPGRGEQAWGRRSIPPHSNGGG